MNRTHCFGPLRSRKTVVTLVALLIMAAGCRPDVTPPGANVAYGQLNLTGYTLLRWRQGLDILVWHDLAGSSWCQGSSSTSDPAYRLRCQGESADGRRAGWEVQTQNGQTAHFSIDGTAYDLAKGRLFLIRTLVGGPGVTQLQRDLSDAQVEDHQSIEMFALRDPDVSAFVGRRDPPGGTKPVEATPTPVPPTSEEPQYDCLATVSATRSLTPNGTGDDCWLTLPDGDSAEITFYDDAQVTYRTPWGGDDIFFFAATKGDRMKKVSGAAIRPARYIALEFGGSIEAVKLYEIAHHSPGNPNGSPACLRDTNNDYRPLTSLCK